MTTVRVKHRDYVPYGWIAIEFCRVDFFGDNKEALEKEWDAIVYKRYYELKDVVDDIECEIDELETRIQDLQTELKKMKQWWRFWHNKKEKEIIKNLNLFYSKKAFLHRKIEKTKEQYFYKPSEQRRMIEEFLKKHNFIFTSSTAAGDECITYTDIWYQNT